MERLRWRDLTVWERIWIYLVFVLLFVLVTAALNHFGVFDRDDDGVGPSAPIPTSPG